MSKLGDTLRGAPIPEATAARERTVKAAQETSRVVDLADSPRWSVARPSRWRGPQWSLAAVLAASVIVALAFTPTGRAIAGDLGRLVGIGDPPTNPPPLGSEQAVVIGSGEAARSYPFEVVAFANKPLNEDGPEACVTVDFPTARAELGAASCLSSDQVPIDEHAIRPVVLPAPPEFSPDGELLVQGMLPADAEASIEYTTVNGLTESASIHEADLTDALGDEIGVASGKSRPSTGSGRGPAWRCDRGAGAF